MLANNIWTLLASLFENVLFLPYDFFRKGISGWWASNTMSWVLILIGFIALFIGWDKCSNTKKKVKKTWHNQKWAVKIN
jgi:hypothetical protein